MEARTVAPKRRTKKDTVSVATAAPAAAPAIAVVSPPVIAATAATVATVATAATAVIAAPPVIAATAVPVATVVTVAAKSKAKKEAKEPKTASKKKQFTVVAVVTPTTIEGNLQPETRKPLIAHLPIHSNEIYFSDSIIQYNPAPPTNVEPYDAAVCDPFMEGAEVLETSATFEPAKVAVTAMTNTVANTVGANTVGANTAVTTVTEVPDYYKKATLLVQFQTSDEIKTLPERVDAACFWCCHTFEWRPVVLPVRDQGDYIQVQGNYCCPECAMAHLFDSRQDSFARWEQLSLLNRIYGSSSGTEVALRPAPPRTILKMFGGPVTIDEYRELIRKGKMRVDIHVPPMVSLLATMDTKPIDFYDISLTKNVMETVGERLAKAEEVLKLKRTKPLKAWESTLDACINLRVRA